MPVSILRPVCGLENYIEETLRSSFLLDHPDYEVIFCAADADDPVLPLVRALMAEYPHIESELLVGNSAVSRNPKLNNLVKGWHAARHAWVMMIDSNVLMTEDHVLRMLAAWRADTGLVCSPPVGSAPADAWAELECGFLNTYQARWQCFADSIGFGFAQGKSMLWRRDILDSAGGIEALANEIAEDAAATKIVRAQGLRVRLVRAPFMQPLGARALGRCLAPAGALGAVAARDVSPLLRARASGRCRAAARRRRAGGRQHRLADRPRAHLVGGDLVWRRSRARACRRLALSWRSVPLWMLRDALLPLLWVAAWTGNDFEWRGNAMSVAADVFGQELTAEP